MGYEDGVGEELIRDYTRRHGLIEPALERDQYYELSAKVDDNTKFMSGGYEHEASYRELMLCGPSTLPFLIEDIQGEGDWWRFQMIGTFAATVLGVCIYFPPEVCGKFELVRQRILDWWETEGAAAFAKLA